jgi:DNA-binding NtrC family response regulator
MDRKITGISEEAMIKLLSYSWPGNIRQMRNVIRKAALLASETIRESHLSFQTEASLISKGNAFFAVYKDDLDKYSCYHDAFAGLTQEFEKELVRQAYHQAHGNIARAARIFGIDRRNFYHKLEKYPGDISLDKD